MYSILHLCLSCDLSLSLSHMIHTHTHTPYTHIQNGPVGFGTLRRSSSIRAPPDETPPDYNTLEMGALGTPYVRTN